LGSVFLPSNAYSTYNPEWCDEALTSKRRDSMRKLFISAALALGVFALAGIAAQPLSAG
jgi:hypothetical protein